MKTVEAAPEDVDLGVSLFRDVVSRCCVDVEDFHAGYFLVDRDEEVAATVERVNSHGVRFDTYELAHEITGDPAD